MHSSNSRYSCNKINLRSSASISASSVRWPDSIPPKLDWFLTTGKPVKPLKSFQYACSYRKVMCLHTCLDLPSCCFSKRGHGNSHPHCCSPSAWLTITSSFAEQYHILRMSPCSLCTLYHLHARWIYRGDSGLCCCVSVIHVT